MALKVSSIQDLGSGAIFLAFGAMAVGEALSHPIGTTLRMGPGYFPLMLGGCLLTIGAILVARSLVLVEPPPGYPRLRPLLAIIGAVVLFTLSVDVLGVVVASVVTLVVSYLGGREFNIVRLLLLCIVTSATVSGIFVYILGMPVSMWPPLWN